MFGQFVMSKFASIGLSLPPRTRFTSSASLMGSATGAASVAEHRRENRQSLLVRPLKKAMVNTSWVVKLFCECRVSFKMLMKMMEEMKKGDLMKIMKMIKMMKKRRSQQVFIIFNLPRLASNSSLLSHPAQIFTLSRLSYPHRRHGNHSL